MGETFFILVVFRKSTNNFIESANFFLLFFYNVHGKVPKIEPQLKVAKDDGREAPSKTSLSTNDDAMLWFHIRPMKISKIRL